MTDNLLTIERTAEIINVSRATIYRMLKAREYEDAIREGRKRREDVPVDVAPYLGCGFPRGVRIGPRTMRLPESRVLAWRQKKCEEAA
jgi:predicted DNA-binding transcriptional regulator AlpA